jgi:XTP/dITP diphosphohydrolase
VIELLVATTNRAKFAEIQSFLRNLPVSLRSLQSLGQWPTVIEDGATFEENALKKARTLARYSGRLTLADDSGLEVDALHGAPGIYSSRYSGEESSDDKNNEKLLKELQDIPEPKRTARFVCALALCAPDSPDGEEWLIRKSCEGRIALARKGKHGFGYDPIFFFPPFGKTFGEIDRETKATVSHRGKALKKLKEILPSLVDLNAKP